MQGTSGSEVSVRSADERVDQLSRQVAEQATKIERQQTELERLRAAMEGMVSGPHPEARGSDRPRRGRTGRTNRDEHADTPGLVSRRRLFGLLSGAAAAGAGLAVAGSTLSAEPADATTGNLQFGAANDAGTDQTSLTSTNSINSLVVENTGSGFALSATSALGTGVPLRATSASGVPVCSLRSSTSALGPPTSGPHVFGDIYQDGGPTLWYCVASGTPGQWQNITGGDRFFPLSSPARVFDSRLSQPNFPANGNTQGPLTFTNPPPSAASRAVNCRWDYSNGVLIDGNIGNARALLINLTVVPVPGSSVGALAVYAGASQPSTSNINWSSGVTVLANAAVSKCDPLTQQVNVAIVASAGASTDFVIDVTGFYV
jgi:uncharacterized coiled-coil protein SlyX